MSRLSFGMPYVDHIITYHRDACLRARYDAGPEGKYGRAQEWALFHHVHAFCGPYAYDDVLSSSGTITPSPRPSAPEAGPAQIGGRGSIAAGDK
jgi:hypothetical protein